MAALLAGEGYLTFLKHISIRNMDITDIPRDQMEKLISVVTEKVWIEIMTPTSRLGSILASVKCTELELRHMGLSQADTRALVTVMRDWVEIVRLSYGVTLDIEELTKYDGRGRCRELVVWRVVSVRRRHEDTLRRWAADAGWTLTGDDFWWLVMQRDG